MRDCMSRGRRYLGDGIESCRDGRQVCRRLDKARAQAACPRASDAMVERAKQRLLGLARAQVAQNLQVRYRRWIEQHQPVHRGGLDGERALDKRDLVRVLDPIDQRRQG